MSLFIESIKLSDGAFYRLQQHQKRINRIFKDIFPEEKVFSLSEIISKQDFPKNGFYKFRLVFDSEIKTLEFLPYRLPVIKSLRVIETSISTSFYKHADREEINRAFLRKGDCDDVLFVQNGLLADTSYCNIALFDGNNWFTPEIPLIYGTQRAQLLLDNKIFAKPINLFELYSSYQSICLFNAMIEFGEIIFPINCIRET